MEHQLADGRIPIGPIDHVGIAVRDLDAAIDRYGRLVGGGVAYREVVQGQDTEVVFLDLPGATSIELIAPLSEASPVTRFLQRQGEGLHHICFLVEDVDRALRQAADAGIPLVDTVGRAGAQGSRVGFVHPSAFGGVLVELKQKP